MQIELITTGQQGQIQLLRVNAKTVARAQPDDVATGLEQLTLVAHRPHRLVAGALQARLYIVCLDAVLEVAQAPDHLTQLED